MATKRVIETVVPEEKDNTSRIALGISVIALIVALFALLGDREEVNVGGISGNNDDGVEKRINELEAKSALQKAQAELLILSQRIGRDPSVNAQSEINDIKNGLEEFSNNPEKEIKQEWKELITELDQLSATAGDEGIVDRINLLILRIQQQIKNEGSR